MDARGRGEGGDPLQKWLQWMEVGSKREVRALITEGRVTVDGEVVTRFAEPIGGEQEIAVDGQPVEGRGARTVLLMNKPIKHLTAIEDEGETWGLGRYLPEGVPRVFPVGRLDYNTQGALLWTNDGGLARRILHPDWSLPKRYGIKLRGFIEADDPGLARMRAGMTVGSVTYQPALVEMGPRRTRATWIFVTISEGKNRQLRRMCAECGYQIVKLRREAVGPVELGELNPRCVRALTDEELLALDRAVGLASDDGAASGESPASASEAAPAVGSEAGDPSA